MRNSISHPKNDFEGIRSLNPRPSFYASVQEYIVLVKLLHWPAVPHMRNSITQGRFGAIIQLQPLPWDDSVGVGVGVGVIVVVLTFFRIIKFVVPGQAGHMCA